MGSKVHDFPLAKEMPPGGVRGFDVRTGEQKWLFRSVPAEGEFGNETWDQGSWKTTGGANAWTLMSADEALGYVYLPFGTPSNDQYGGHRPGDGLFGESLVCLDAQDRQAHLALPDGPSRGVGLRPARGAQPRRRPGERGARQGRRAVEQAGLLLRLRPRDGQADLAHRGAARPAIDGARRTNVPDPAFPDQARALRPAGGHRGRRDRLHAGTAQGRAGRPAEVQLRPAVHAAVAREADDPDARHRRGGELGGRGVRPRDRDPVRAVDHAPVRGHAGEVAGPACRLCRDVRPGGVDGRASPSGSRPTAGSPPST